jgi:murein DD-endopeptidase MepM/ murein hydrolase activator NlpD
VTSPVVPPPQPPPPPYVVPEPAGATPSMSTAQVDAIVPKLAKHLHISVRGAYLDVAGPFPVAGKAHWSNDWHAFRPCPYPHVHEGLDIFAAEGTPVVAVANGSIAQIADPITGLGITLSTAGGMDYLYAHLSAYAPGTPSGTTVKVGQLIGFVGNTGDASEGAPHLHFQAEPGGIPMPPKPLVDRWVRREARRASELLAKPRRHVHTGIRSALAIGMPAIEQRQPPVAPFRPADRFDPSPVRAMISVKATSPVPLSLLGGIVALLLVGVVLRLRSRPRGNAEEEELGAGFEPAT